MHWDDYRILLAVTRAGQAGAAAAGLGLSHATVSRRIAELEKRYGVNLVDRSSQSWLITPLGRELAGLAEKMETQAFEFDRLSRAHSEDMAGLIRLSLPPALLAPLLAPALTGFEAEFPDISLSFSVESNWADLPARKADIAIRFGEAPQGDLIGDEIGPVSWGLFAGTDLFQRLSDAPRDARSNVPLIETEPSQEPAQWAKKYFHPDCKRHFVYGFEEKAALARAGFGVTMLPRIIGDPDTELRHLSWLPITFQTRLWVLANKDTRTSKRIGKVRQAIGKRLKAQRTSLCPE
jgi:DNA-binding transcriptional LysR family regulator